MVGEQPGLCWQGSEVSFAAGIPATARRIQMLEQRVPCNLVIALWAAAEIRASAGEQPPSHPCRGAAGSGLFILFMVCREGKQILFALLLLILYASEMC